MRVTVVLVTFGLLLTAGISMIGMTRRLFRLLGLVVVGAAVILVTSWYTGTNTFEMVKTTFAIGTE